MANLKLSDEFLKSLDKLGKLQYINKILIKFSEVRDGSEFFNKLLYRLNDLRLKLIDNVENKDIDTWLLVREVKVTSNNEIIKYLGCSKDVFFFSTSHKTRLTCTRIEFLENLCDDYLEIL